MSGFGLDPDWDDNDPNPKLAAYHRALDRLAWREIAAKDARIEAEEREAQQTAAQPLPGKPS